jgi:hypothetical protein
VDRRGNRPRAAARCAATAVALLAVACGESPGPAGPITGSAVGASADAEAMRAAEATVRAFFAVKGRAQDPISVLIDEQAAYLTSRDVHPTTAYDVSRSDRPSGITDTDKRVELPNTRMVGDEVLVDFAAEWTSVSYMFIDDVMQLDRGQPGAGFWDGTATLEQREGKWLINHLTMVRNGGSIG